MSEMYFYIWEFAGSIIILVCGGVWIGRKIIAQRLNKNSPRSQSSL
jgi:uncharacterized protein YneF (UPF0154 family)